MLLLESASNLARASDARAIMVYADALPEVSAVPARTILVLREGGDPRRVSSVFLSAAGSISVPAVTLSRFGQITLATIIALSNRLIDVGDTIVCLSGPYRSIIDTILVMTVGADFELFDATDQTAEDEPIRRAVFHRLLGIALQLGQHGREGRRTGAIFVIGDSEHVIKQSEQMILNPFRGYTEEERNVLDDRMTETLKEFSTLDGAFIISGTGIVETAGARIRVGISEGLPSGLGSRHAAAAGITALTRSIAITVSSSDGNVRVWRAGRMLAEFEPGM
jgi:DNA integrity scanning protein DisA with diadenylate cyclase activity